MTFANVAAYLNDNANYPTKRERDAAKRESERLAKLRREWAKANGVSEDHDPFAQFE